jgi:hypothetical protein
MHSNAAYAFKLGKWERCDEISRGLLGSCITSSSASPIIRLFAAMNFRLGPSLNNFNRKRLTISLAFFLASASKKV